MKNKIPFHLYSLVDLIGNKGDRLRGCILGQMCHVEAFAGKSSGKGSANSNSDAKAAKCHSLESDT